ncbi:MAG: hypothetical protein ACRERE_35345 [Candidatus Entotheonellia bacterium]
MADLLRHDNLHHTFTVSPKVPETACQRFHVQGIRIVEINYRGALRPLRLARVQASTHDARC